MTADDHQNTQDELRNCISVYTVYANIGVKKKKKYDLNARNEQCERIKSLYMHMNTDQKNVNRK
jgi:hypothetical protein